MNKHWTDQDLDLFLSGEELAGERMEHLQNCLSCRRRIDTFRRLVHDAAAELESELPEPEEQVDAILQRIASEGPRRARLGHSRLVLRRSLLMAAATLLIVLGGLSLRPGGRAKLSPTPRPELQIEEILSTADALLADNSIPGFEGLDGLAEDDLDLVLDGKNS